MPLPHVAILVLCFQRDKIENRFWRVAGGEELVVSEGTCVWNSIERKILIFSISLQRVARGKHRHRLTSLSRFTAN